MSVPPASWRFVDGPAGFSRSPGNRIGWRSSSDRPAEVETVGLPATVRGYRFEVDRKRVTIDVTIGKDPGGAPNGGPRLGLARLVVEVEGYLDEETPDEVLTQSEVHALPLHKVMVAAVQHAIAHGKGDPTSAPPSGSFGRRPSGGHRRAGRMTATSAL